jgi:hypothetical protein
MSDNKLKELAETPATWYKEGALVRIFNIAAALNTN